MSSSECVRIPARARFVRLGNGMGGGGLGWESGVIGNCGKINSLFMGVAWNARSSAENAEQGA